ncbi:MULTISPECIES: hypothetical protein [unclassified Mesorhizobium]|uniref:hypothetical protein n=1 Tax=unclassified Mesorhizobium TaxID=325217 RepID=UPI001127AF78|nr:MULTISPECIES: hypothetical protein [unclassified Mesorhizobium]MCA0001366.1 hypothetical protein [Mesorhizobium sp. B264B2A]MCA0004395.1 hypothetical protein [Mesorhizobium sp. B264B1B]MCA0019882.1 hypothetical protein [Mesorhizobium sp. B264B1A]TPJ47668.1 hypothetical protein FJ437_09120 [Mesorhizobium sp. B2-6-6]
MKKLHPAAAAMTIAVLLAGVLRHSGYSTYGPIDTAILVVFLVRQVSEPRFSARPIVVFDQATKSYISPGQRRPGGKSSR